MGSKDIRQRQVIELVQKGEMRTQGQIVSAVRECGCKVSQSTLSKDIKELGLVKVPTVDGKVRYSLPEERTPFPKRQKILEREMMDSLVDFDNAKNILVLKTTPGNASGLAAAIDKMDWHEVLGTLAGDDVILIISKTADQTQKIMDRIRGSIHR